MPRSRPAPTGRVVGPLAAAVVAGLSRFRGERVIHGSGLGLAARLDVTGGLGLGVPLLDEPASYDVLVRLSRGIGLPDGWPDLLGLAVRVPDAHGPGRPQDLLLDTGAAPPLLRRVPLPQRSVLRSTYSSLLPYDAAGTRLLLGALPVEGAPDVRVLGRLDPRQVAFRLCVASAHGPWREVGRLHGTGPAAHVRSVRFSPFTSGGGLQPAGALQALRRASYEAAHVGRAETRPERAG